MVCVYSVTVGVKKSLEARNRHFADLKKINKILIKLINIGINFNLFITSNFLRNIGTSQVHSVSVALATQELLTIWS